MIVRTRQAASLPMYHFTHFRMARLYIIMCKLIWSKPRSISQKICTFAKIPTANLTLISDEGNSGGRFLTTLISDESNLGE